MKHYTLGVGGYVSPITVDSLPSASKTSIRLLCTGDYIVGYIGGNNNPIYYLQRMIGSSYNGPRISIFNVSVPSAHPLTYNPNGSFDVLVNAGGDGDYYLYRYDANGNPTTQELLWDFLTLANPPNISAGCCGNYAIIYELSNSQNIMVREYNYADNPSPDYQVNQNQP